METQLDTYVKSLIPEFYSLLGVKLRPFSLGHIFLMRRFGCKFSADDPNTMGGIDDLLLGIAICCRSYEGFLEFIDDPVEFNKWCKKWGKYIKKHVRKNKNFNLIKQFHLFKEYMKSGIIIPKYWETQNTESSMESGSHWTQSVYNVLISDLGYNQTDALNIPVSKALNEYYKHLEKNGIINLMSDEELELINVNN